MERQEAINQYHTEVALYEQYGTFNIITFEEWLYIKGIQLNDKNNNMELKDYTTEQLKDELKRRADEKKAQKAEEKVYDEYMDEECISLCDKLNSLSSIETIESCCGHYKNPYMIFFDCYDFIRLGKLYRCVNKNYSDGKWRIECCCSDSSPTYGFLLTSKEPFKSKEEMMKSVNDLIENIDYWENPRFDSYFNNNNGR